MQKKRSSKRREVQKEEKIIKNINNNTYLSCPAI
jgi:hypothetical protein